MSLFQTLLENAEGLNPEVKEQMSQLFEAKVEESVQVRIAESTEQLKEAHEAEMAELREEMSQLSESSSEDAIQKLAENLDVFLEQTVADWANNNAVALQEASLVRGAATFLQNITEGAKAFNTTVPETDVEQQLKESNQEIAQLKEQLNDRSTQLFESKKANIAFQRQHITESLIDSNMTDISKDKFRGLCENANFETPEQFTRLATGLKSLALNEATSDGDHEVPNKSAIDPKTRMSSGKMMEMSMDKTSKAAKMMEEAMSMKDETMKKEKMKEAKCMMDEAENMKKNSKMMSEAEKMMDEGKKMMDEGNYGAGGKKMEKAKCMMDEAMGDGSSTGGFTGGMGKQKSDGKSVNESHNSGGVDMSLFLK